MRYANNDIMGFYRYWNNRAWVQAKRSTSSDPPYYLSWEEIEKGILLLYTYSTSVTYFHSECHLYLYINSDNVLFCGFFVEKQ